MTDIVATFSPRIKAGLGRALDKLNKQFLNANKHLASLNASSRKFNVRSLAVAGRTARDVSRGLMNMDRAMAKTVITSRKYSQGVKKANNETFRLNITAKDFIRAGVLGMPNALDRTSRSMTRFHRVTNRAMGPSGLGGAPAKAARASIALRALGAAAGALAFGFTTIYTTWRILSNAIKRADAWTQLNNRLRIVSQSQEELNFSLDKLTHLAVHTRSDLASLGVAYQRVDLAAQKLGYSTYDSHQVVETLALGIKTTGVSAHEATAALRQFTQALNKGKLDGDEFRSMGENLPIVLDAIAKEAGVTRAELFQMAEDGLIRSKLIMDGMLSATGKVRKNFKKMQATVQEAGVSMSAAWTKFVGKLDESLKLTKRLAGWILKMAKALERLSKPMGNYQTGKRAYMMDYLTRMQVREQKFIDAIDKRVAEHTKKGTLTPQLKAYFKDLKDQHQKTLDDLGRQWDEFQGKFIRPRKIPPKTKEDEALTKVQAWRKELVTILKMQQGGLYPKQKDFQTRLKTFKTKIQSGRVATDFGPLLLKSAEAMKELKELDVELEKLIIDKKKKKKKPERDPAVEDAKQLAEDFRALNIERALGLFPKAKDFHEAMADLGDRHLKLFAKYPDAVDSNKKFRAELANLSATMDEGVETSRNYLKEREKAEAFDKKWNKIMERWQKEDEKARKKNLKLLERELEFRKRAISEISKALTSGAAEGFKKGAGGKLGEIGAGVIGTGGSLAQTGVEGAMSAKIAAAAAGKTISTSAMVAAGVQTAGVAAFAMFAKWFAKKAGEAIGERFKSDKQREREQRERDLQDPRSRASRDQQRISWRWFTEEQIKTQFEQGWIKAHERDQKFADLAKQMKEYATSMADRMGPQEVEMWKKAIKRVEKLGNVAEKSADQLLEEANARAEAYKLEAQIQRASAQDLTQRSNVVTINREADQRSPTVKPPDPAAFNLNVYNFDDQQAMEDEMGRHPGENNFVNNFRRNSNEVEDFVA